MTSPIQPHHHQKMAYVYLRQSTMGQVRHHQESTARQYALKDKASHLGWLARSLHQGMTCNHRVEDGGDGARGKVKSGQNAPF
jgi:DNA invertase Pin-like site-specific DNA recombinase